MLETGVSQPWTDFLREKVLETGVSQLKLGFKADSNHGLMLNLTMNNRPLKYWQNSAPVW